MQRSVERERSRDRKRGYQRDRDSSQQRTRSRYDRYQQRVKYDDKKHRKSVKFDQNLDIKVFRRDDEPTAKTLTETDLNEFKAKMEKQYEKKDYMFNSEEIKHLEARMQSNSMKQQKQKQKSINEKLLGVRQQISYYPPGVLADSRQVIAPQSFEKQAHAQRTGNQLGCYYSSANQIPNQPTFQILNNMSSTAPIPISYQRTFSSYHQSQYHQTQKRDQKPLIGILKDPFSIQKIDIDVKNDPYPSVNPNLVKIIQQISRNRDKYNKQIIASMLQPFKQSGDLQKLHSNTALYKSIVESAQNPQFNPVIQPQNSYNRQYNRDYRPSPPVIVDKRPNVSGAMMNPGAFYAGGAGRTDKFKTVPCKYFHSPQGCVKKQDCTFIHDQQYAGKPTPNMHRYVKSTPPQTPYGGFYAGNNNQGGMGSGTSYGGYDGYSNNINSTYNAGHNPIHNAGHNQPQNTGYNNAYGNQGVNPNQGMNPNHNPSTYPPYGASGNPNGMGGGFHNGVYGSGNNYYGSYKNN